MNENTKHIIKQSRSLHGGMSMHKKSAPFYLEILKKIKSGKVLDIGCGRGTFAKIVKSEFPNRFELHGLEIFDPYLGSVSDYEHVWISDIRKSYMQHADNYDIFVFIDILEHMHKEEAIEIIEYLQSKNKAIIVSIPTDEKHWKQDESYIEQNPNEAHIHDWTIDEVVYDLNLCFYGTESAVSVFYSGIE